MIKFEITDDNRPFLEARGKVILNACPGSGKTSAIAYKLSMLTSECEAQFGNYSGIACLSFTNVAKDEIIEKFKALTGNSLRYPHLVSTIDSFINQYITLPFYYLRGLTCQRPNIMNSVDFLDQLELGKFYSKTKKPLQRVYKPSKLGIEYDGSYTWNGHYPNEENVDIGVFRQYAKKHKEWQFEKGYLNNDDSTFAACQLLKRFPEIGRSLVERFPYIIIDEAQDTSEIQYSIFDSLISAGLKNVEFVGDPYQSLYEFRNAKPELFMARFNDRKNWKGHTFKDCRRSSQHIVNVYDMLRNTSQQKITSICKHTSNHKLKVIVYDESEPNNLLERYYKLVNPTAKNVILVRGETHLEQFGSGSNSENPWKSGLAKMLIEAVGYFKENKLKSCIDMLRKFLVEIRLPKADYNERRKYYDEIFTEEATNMNLSAFIRKIPSLDNTISTWHDQVTSCIDDFFGIKVDLQLKQKKGKPYYEQNLRDMFFPKVSTVYPVSTIHRVKGMTFGSILLVLSGGGNSNTISLSDFFPQVGFLSESQRLIYVALSRPETLCCIAIPDKVPYTEIVARLGADIEFA